MGASEREPIGVSTWEGATSEDEWRLKQPELNYPAI